MRANLPEVARTAVGIVLGLVSSPLAAQAPWLAPGAQAIGVFTQQNPIPGGGSLGEARLVQPVAMIEAGWGRLTLTATADVEGLTIPNGELTIGAYGEGFVDRRHPHTYVHELILAAHDVLGRADGPASLSLALGKGFAPFGPDDPMSRPVERYPVNHHLAQILERALVGAGVRVGPALLEAALFNGDEPENPSEWPKVSRVGDSWSARLTVSPLRGVEWEASLARVHSPEQRGGAGPDQSKWNTSARYQGSDGAAQWYGLLSIARTSEANGAFVFQSQAAEGSVTLGRHTPYLRIERTERPEEERTTDPFRTVRPLLESSILGVTRWTIFTAGYGYDLRPRGPLAVRPFGEVSYARIAKVGSGLFDPQTTYGRTFSWTLSVGVAVRWKMTGHRMGHYLDDRAMSGMAGMRGM